MSTPRGRVREVAWVFLRLGVVAFGGPAAHTAMMRDELVRRRGWVSDDRFVDLVGATNLVPGPNSTELAIHLGHDRAGWRGLLVAGACFIVPAALMVTGLAWAYVEHGSTPAAEGLLYGVVPAVLAVVAHALVGLLRTVLGLGPGRRARWDLAALAAACLAAYLLGVGELVVLAGAAVVGVLAHAARRLQAAGPAALVAPVLAAAGGPTYADPTGAQLAQLLWTFLRIGAVLYGSGYVLLAFLEGTVVEDLGWLTRAQLLDAVAVGQVTPGPLFTTATFVGYLVAGPVGAFVATVGIFAPSFLFVAALTRITTWLRATPWTAPVLDAVNAAALALMAGVGLVLARQAYVDPLTVAVGLVSLVLLLATRLNSAWLVLGGAVVGVAAAAAGIA